MSLTRLPFITMDPPIQYYKRQAEHGREDIVSIYTASYFVHRGHGLGNILRDYLGFSDRFFGAVPNLGKEVIKALGRWALRTGTNIIEKLPQILPHRQTTILRHVTA
jgi:hypothetical protein